MIGIVDIGAYVPHYRVSRAAMGEAWRLEQAKALLIGERSVAGFDEDCITMAVEAVLHALAARDGSSVDALFFASTTPPFGEKSSAAVIAAACDLPASRTIDVSSSLRAGTSALALALDALRAGSARRVIVAAADMRRPEPGSLLEAISGDGAAAIIVGSGDDVIAELIGEYYVSDPTLDVWRRQNDRYLQTDDEAFTNQVGYFAMVDTVVKGLLKASEVDPLTITGVALYAPDGRAYMNAAKQSALGATFARMGASGPAPSLLMHVGNLGTAFAMAQLALLMENVKAGDVLALIGYGDGADAYLFRVTDAIVRRPARRSIQSWIDSKAELPYTLATFFRENLIDKPMFPTNVEPWTSLPLLYRERDELLRFHAQKCGNCGALWWPHRPNCYDCGAQDGFTNIRMSRRGVVSSFVVEWAVPSPLSPVGMLTVDTPEGARITNQSTGADARGFSIGDEVEFVLRIFHMAKNIPHYSWKVRKTYG